MNESQYQDSKKRFARLTPDYFRVKIRPSWLRVELVGSKGHISALNLSWFRGSQYAAFPAMDAKRAGLNDSRLLKFVLGAQLVKSVPSRLDVLRRHGQIIR
jgi:hypothetical protein